MGESASTDHVKRVERELAKEDSLLANMIQQAPGMLGMAFMLTQYLQILLYQFQELLGEHIWARISMGFIIQN